MIKYNGTRWHKCDFHLHTIASDCFEDKEVNASDWVTRAVEQGLNCVAITDHNTGAGIDEVINAAKDTDLTVFPGVEITCDTSKVHLLILFDVDKTSTDVEDFLITCGIQRSEFGTQDAYTVKSILNIAEIANNNGCIVIPAHIDEYNGLGDISNAILQEFYNLEYINSVQIVHQEFLDTSLQVNNNTELKAVFDDNYSTNIDYSTIKNWQTPVKVAIEKEKALLTFSDNPHNHDSSKHGLWGIGNKYSWIKMEEKPTLEGLRQALLLPSMRIRNYYQTACNPYQLPDLWIKSMSVSQTEITEEGLLFQIEFCPQLTTIIGGRGSGKSSILRFLRGVFSKTIGTDLSNIVEDQKHFYKRYESRDGKGVLTSNSIIEVIFIRNDIEYKIEVSNIHTQENQIVLIHRYNKETDTWDEITEERFIEFFEFEHYSQKQIYEIAQKPNSLRERIDNAIVVMESLMHERDVIYSEYLAKSAQIRTVQEQISGKGKLLTEVKDIIDQIELYKKSKIADLVKKRSKFIENEQKISTFLENVTTQENFLVKFIDSFKIPVISIDNFDEIHKLEILKMYSSINTVYEDAKEQLVVLQKTIEQAKEDFSSTIKTSTWNTEFIQNTKEFQEEKIRLESEGLSDIENFEKLTQAKEDKDKVHAVIMQEEEKLLSEILNKESLQAQYINKLEEISLQRIEFVDSILIDQSVKINIKPFRNKDDFEYSLREIIQKEDRFYDDIEALKNICFTGGIVKDKMNEFRLVINQLRNNESVDGITGHFKNVIAGLTDAQVDQLMLLMPEDEIEVQYKPSGSNTFKSLSTASAGQKTTAILTFILSYGNTPLILDQPEDDLDNRLVYELIVDRLKKAKENRQIIIVTHNANIPVNGDAEYIISMDSESKFLKILTDGSVDQISIKKEICDVMEGSEIAFNMRSKRYKQINL